MRAQVLRGLTAGAVAGLLTGLIGWLVAEPALQAAIAREPAGGTQLFSRSTQAGGLVLGFVLVGAALGVLFALSYRVLPGDVQAAPWPRSLALALGGFCALYLVPFLRYPANPPGVGTQETLDARTRAYLLAVMLGVVVSTGSYAAVRSLARRGLPAWQRQVLVGTGVLLVLGLGYALLPDAQAPLKDIPASLVWDFRLRSLGLQALLYTLLGAVFGVLSERAANCATTVLAPADRG